MENDPRFKHKYYAWFLVTDFDLHPNEITKQIGIDPTKTKVKGEYRIVGKKNPQKVLNKKSQWILDSDLPNNISIEKHIEYLLNKVKSHKQNFINLSHKYKVELICAVYYYEANPGISLDKDILNEIAELNVPLYFDIYCLNDDDK